MFTPNLEEILSNSFDKNIFLRWGCKPSTIRSWFDLWNTQGFTPVENEVLCWILGSPNFAQPSFWSTQTFSGAFHGIPLPETLHIKFAAWKSLKMDGSEDPFLLGWPISAGALAVRFRVRVAILKKKLIFQLNKNCPSGTHCFGVCWTVPNWVEISRRSTSYDLQQTSTKTFRVNFLAILLLYRRRHGWCGWSLKKQMPKTTRNNSVCGFNPVVTKNPQIEAKTNTSLQ